MKTRLIQLSVIAMVLFVGTGLLRKVTGGDEPDVSPSATVSDVGLTDVPPAAIAEVDRLIRLFEARIVDGNDPLDYRTLGKHYLERAYLTGDLSAYGRALEVLDHALELAPGVAEAELDLATAQIGVHDFSGALETASTVIVADPQNLRGQLILGDSLAALGRYSEADAAYATVERAVGEDQSVLVRQAELAWQTGDQAAAVRLSSKAAELAITRSLDVRSLAFYLVQKGRHLSNVGAYGEAVESLTAAREADPFWAPVHAELGRALGALGDIEGAMAELEEAVSLFPSIDWLALLGDYQNLAGHTEAATSTFETIEVVVAVNGGTALNARPLSRFFSDHGRDISEAVELATADLKVRQDVYAYDTAAWAWYQAGEVERAFDAASTALGLGSKDPLVLFHAGMIANAKGEIDLAREYLSGALELDGAFHPIHADTARLILESLG